MAKMKFGLVGSTSGAGSSKQNNNLENKISNAQGKVVAARVIDIVLDENHKYYGDVGRWNGIGAIFYEIVNKSGTKSYPNFALPYDAQLKTYPLINEIVLLISLPNQSMGFVSSNESYFYMSPLGIWNHPHHNAYPNVLDKINDEEQTRDYPSSTSGSVRQVTDGSTEINLNSSNTSQNTFPEKEKEKSNIHPLMPFMGDSLLEGRYGQSLRFGSTAKSKSEKKNNWSNSGENGDPITILRNGQPSKVSNEGWVPITEDINKDLSSIYLTSTQKIPIELAREEKLKWINSPKFPSQYSTPQILLNSGQITINSSEGSLLLSAKKSIGLSCYNEINLIGNDIVLDTSRLYLGSKDAKEPVLLGNKTVNTLKQLTSLLKQICKILQLDQIYPAGLPAPNGPLNAVSLTIADILSNIEVNLDDLKSTNVKTI
jgi:hypothetical protein